jgi:hypothetical protein
VEKPGWFFHSLLEKRSEARFSRCLRLMFQNFSFETASCTIFYISYTEKDMKFHTKRPAIPFARFDQKS